MWDVVNRGYNVLADVFTLSVGQRNVLKENQQRNSQALLVLQMSLADEYFSRIMGATCAKAAWEKLREEFQGNEKVHATKIQALRRKFENLKMKDSKTAKDYYSRVDEILNQLRAYRDNIPENKVVGKI